MTPQMLTVTFAVMSAIANKLLFFFI